MSVKPTGSVFDVKQQLAFYGAYHSNRINVLIHMIFVPTILWTWISIMAHFPVPSFFPQYHYRINDYLALDVNLSTIQAVGYFLYYLKLEPVAAILYLPEMLLGYLTAMSFAHTEGGLKNAIILFFVAWFAQFAGHGFAEKRAPALTDDPVGALVLAPFFVHLEILFALGYKPELHKQIQSATGLKIAEIRKAEGAKRRAQGKKE